MSQSNHLERWHNQQFLRESQYKDSSNLGARIQLHKLFSTNTHDLHRWLFELMLATFGSQARILEVGCGRGDLWAANVDRIPAGWQITLTDFSQGMLDDARKQIGAAAENFDMRVADIQELPFENATFDGVIANFMLYHVPDRTKGIGELRRVLKPQGSLHAATLGKQHMWEYQELLRQFAPQVSMGAQHVDQTFGLENGAEQLSASFGDVQFIQYDCDLAVTDAAPMMDYVSSMVMGKEVLDEQREAMRVHLNQAIADKGYFFIRKASGTFVARGNA
jgi:ubiquinone/menaquinone biosynthesis C-methylase UbiE